VSRGRNSIKIISQRSISLTSPAISFKKEKKKEKKGKLSSSTAPSRSSSSLDYEEFMSAGYPPRVHVWRVCTRLSCGCREGKKDKKKKVQFRRNNASRLKTEGPIQF
jgi:hypothetical protein